MFHESSIKYAVVLGIGIVIIFALVQIYEALSQPKNTTLAINQKKITIEIADTNAKRTQGLSGRESLDKNSGMLFVFPNKEKHSFWMFDMKFPLDFIWIDDDQVVDLTENVPPPSSNTPDTFEPKIPVNKILEVNAGFIKENNIKIGDKVEY